MLGLVISPLRALLSKVGNEINNPTTSLVSKGQLGPGTGLAKSRKAIRERLQAKDDLFYPHLSPFSAHVKPGAEEGLAVPENTALLPLSANFLFSLKPERKPVHCWVGPWTPGNSSLPQAP